MKTSQPGNSSSMSSSVTHGRFNELPGQADLAETIFVPIVANTVRCMYAANNSDSAAGYSPRNGTRLLRTRQRGPAIARLPATYLSGLGTRQRGPTVVHSPAVYSPGVTSRNRYPEDSSDPAEIRTISILRRLPTRRARQVTHVMPDKLTRAVILQ
jgi:hypothetical protein